MERSISMPIGVVVERREIDNRWHPWTWKVAVIPGAPPVDAWRELVRGDRFVRWHAATLPLELHRAETDAYRANLAGRSPGIYVVLRKTTPSERTAGNEVVPFLVTASPYEAEGYMEGEDLVEAAPMPQALLAWVQEFVERHHVERPFVKRERKRVKGGQRAGDSRANGAAFPAVRQRGSDG